MKKSIRCKEKNRHVGLSFLFSLFFILLKAHTYAAAPHWSTGSPSVIHGASSIDLNVNLDGAGKVYYVIYNALPASLTAISIKTNALATLQGSIVANGTIGVSTAGTDYVKSITPLKDNTTYYVCLIAESVAVELQNDSDLKKITCVLPKRQSQSSYNSNYSPGAVIGYNVYFPEAYYKVKDHNFPFLLFLHGSTEKTWPETQVGDLSKVRIYGPPKLIDQGQEFPFIVVSPQCGFGDWDNGRPGVLVSEIVEYMKSQYNIDPSRIYVTGLSMGGRGTYSYFQNNPDKVAAAIPISGWNDLGKACFAKDVPLWAFHSKNDGVVSPNSDINLIPQINKCIPAPNPLAKLTLYDPGFGHNCWDVTYKNTGPGIAPDNIYNWLLRHVKGNIAPEDGTNTSPSAYAGKDTAYTGTSAISLQGLGYDLDGAVTSFKWTKLSGPDIILSGENSGNLTLSNWTSGKYVFRLTVTDNGSRTAFDEVNVSIGTTGTVTSVNVENTSEEISIDPNPIGDKLNIKIGSANSGNINFTIVNMEGKAIYSFNKYIAKGVSVVSLEADEINLTKGIFCLKIFTEAGINKVLKFVKD